MSLKQKLKAKELTIGSWLTIGDESTTEIMCQAGFDWLVVDMEHSAITVESAQKMIRIIELYGISPLVRVSENDPTLIKRVMDSGANGVIVPMVNSKEDAEKAVKSVKYPPVGFRGVGLARAQKYGLGFPEYKEKNDSESVVIVQIEHIDAVNNFKDIVTTDGVDGFIIGPYDLSASIGHPGEFDNPLVLEALEKVKALSAELNVLSGFHVINPEKADFDAKLNEGYKFLAYSLDSLILASKCKKMVKEVRK